MATTDFDSNISLDGAREKVLSVFNLSSLGDAKGHYAMSLLKAAKESTDSRKSTPNDPDYQEEAARGDTPTVDEEGGHQHNAPSATNTNKRSHPPLSDLSKDFEFYQFGGKGERSGAVLAEGFVVKRFRVLAGDTGPKINTTHFFVGLNPESQDVQDFSVQSVCQLKSKTGKPR